MATAATGSVWVLAACNGVDDGRAVLVLVLVVGAADVVGIGKDRGALSRSRRPRLILMCCLWLWRGSEDDGVDVMMVSSLFAPVVRPPVLGDSKLGEI